MLNIFQCDLKFFSVHEQQKKIFNIVIINVVSFVNIFQCDFQCHNFIV